MGNTTVSTEVTTRKAGPSRQSAIKLTKETLKFAVEAALLAAGRPLSLNDLMGLFEGEGASAPTRQQLRAALGKLAEDWEARGLELREVGSGYRLQVRPEYSRWMGRLWAERPPRYSRALLETLALIAYRQPITRGEIEDVRGVSISSSIVKTLLEREWIRVLGHREVPGRPALYGTTKQFLDDFGLASLEQLPPLSDIKDIDNLGADLFSDHAAGTSESTVAPPQSQTSDLDQASVTPANEDETVAGATPLVDGAVDEADVRGNGQSGGGDH